MKWSWMGLFKAVFHITFIADLFRVRTHQEILYRCWQLLPGTQSDPVGYWAAFGGGFMCPPDGNRAESNGAGVPQLQLKLQINLSIGFVVRGAGSVCLPDP